MITVKNFSRVQREVAYAFERVPFFRQHMDQAQLCPTDIATPEAMLKLPPTQKAHYRKNFPAGVLARGHTLDEPFLYRNQSSGTEGERLVSVTHSFTLAQRMATCLRMNPAFAFVLQKKQRRTCRYAAPNCSDVECSNPNSLLADRLLPDGTLVLPVYHDLLTTPDKMLAMAGAEIAEYKPDFMYVDPTHLSVLVRHLAREGVAPHATTGVAIGASYTLCTAVSRRQIQGYYGPGVPFAEVVAMSEFGYVAMECPAGRLHMNTTDYYMEVLVDGRDAGPGELGELYVTSLGDEVSPHIRYKTGDLYRVMEEGACACGSKHPVVRAEGRAGNSIRRDGAIVLTPRALDDVVGPAAFVDLYALEQLGSGTCVFRFIANATADEAAVKGLKERLEAAVGGLALRMESVKYIPSDRGGKFITCRSQAKAAA